MLLWIILRNFRTLDEYFDGIVYAVCVGVGFGFVENIEYFIASSDSINSRTLLPAHFFFAILMGYYVGRAHFEEGMKRKKLLILALVIPMIIHFTWDFIIFNVDMFYESDSILALLYIEFLLFYILLILIAVRYVKKNRKADAELRETARFEEIQRIKTEAIAEYLSEREKQMNEALKKEPEQPQRQQSNEMNNEV